MTESSKAVVPERENGEIWDEKLSRVELMASSDSTWDLSDNDLAALQTVLKDRAWMEKCWVETERVKHELQHELTVAREQIQKLEKYVNLCPEHQDHMRRGHMPMARCVRCILSRATTSRLQAEAQLAAHERTIAELRQALENIKESYLRGEEHDLDTIIFIVDAALAQPQIEPASPEVKP